jgi:hypothetical protein
VCTDYVLKVTCYVGDSENIIVMVACLLIVGVVTEVILVCASVILCVVRLIFL